MNRNRGFTLVELLVVVGILSLLAAILIPVLQQANHATNETVCLSNLSGVAKASTLYKEANNGRWPWIDNVVSDFSAVRTGTNRDRDPYAGASGPGARAVTALMFLLVRDGHPVELLACPGDEDVIPDWDIACDSGGQGTGEPAEIAWDFHEAYNCSYSWQAPVFRGGRYVSGISNDDPDTVVMGDKTPRYAEPSWSPDAIEPAGMAPGRVARNMSQNHRRGRRMNVLYASMTVARADRPDVGYLADNVYTAAARRRRGGRGATSLSLEDHLSTRDSFLIGPIGDAHADDAVPVNLRELAPERRCCLK